MTTVRCFCLGGCGISFRFPDAEVEGMVAHLLRYHQAERTQVCEHWVQFVRGAYGRKGHLVQQTAVSATAHEWIWGVPASFPPEWSAEHFFYWILSPLLSTVLAASQLTRLHGALLFEADQGSSIILLGKRGAGKSSTVAAWVENGGMMATDDVIWLQKEGQTLHCYGLKRELHLDPALIDRLPRLPALNQAHPYLPGKPRLAYDWVHHFPQQSREKLLPPRHIIHSQVVPDQPSTLSPLDNDQLTHLLDEFMNEEVSNQHLPPSLQLFTKQILTQAQGWQVSWGEDIWAYPGKHRTFLQSHLKRQLEEPAS